MAVKQHSQVIEGARHPIHNLTYPDASDRINELNEGSGIALTSANQYQIAKQDDDNSLWQLTDTGPAVWSQLWSSDNATVDTDNDGLKITTNDGIGVLSMYAPSDSPNTVIGYAGNTITAEVGNLIIGGGSLGTENSITGASTGYATVIGGISNIIDGDAALNPADGAASIIVGGAYNTASAPLCSILGGQNNTSAGLMSSILSGEDNLVSGEAATSIGSYCNVTAEGAVAINDHSGTVLTVSNANQFRSHFTYGYHITGGNFGINTSFVPGVLTVKTDSSSSEIATFLSPTSDKSVTIETDSANAGVIEICNPVGATSIRAQATPPRIGIGTPSPTEPLDVSGDVIRLRNSKTPASASDTGFQGSIAWDADYIYICVATDTWKRVGISTW